MKRTDSNVKVLAAIIVLLGISLGLMAQPGQQQRQHQHEGQNCSGLVDLTEEQKAEIKAIHLERMKAVQPLKDEIKINRAKINALVKKDDPDMKEITGLVEANGKLLTQVRILQIDSRIKERSLLTEDQKVVWDAHHGKLKRRKALSEHRRGQRPHGERGKF
jgi:Spy/CpxP family protein refolding chaperone